MGKMKKQDIQYRISTGILLVIQASLFLWWNGFSVWWKVSVLLLIMLIGLHNLSSGAFYWKMEKLRKRQNQVYSEHAEQDEELDEWEERHRSGRRGSPSRWYWRNAKDISSINNFAGILLGLILFYAPVIASYDWITWTHKVIGVLGVLSGLYCLYLSVWKRSRRDIEIEEIRSEKRLEELEKENTQGRSYGDSLKRREPCE